MRMQFNLFHETIRARSALIDEYLYGVELRGRQSLSSEIKDKHPCKKVRQTEKSQGVQHSSITCVTGSRGTAC